MRVAAIMIALLGSGLASGAERLHVVNADMDALVRAAAVVPVQFAVQVPQSVSIDRDGAWSTSGDTATWRYAVRVPTAISMSFHATSIRLPLGATLQVRGAGVLTSYAAADLRGTDLWSRVHPGDTLELTVTVPAGSRAQLRLNISGLQAGYRSLGGAVRDHPAYARMKAAGLAAAGTSCVQNYACNENAGNQAPSQSTVALVVQNLYQCTGTLINDIPGDNTPYVLTARHCESGQLGGGSPGAAGAVTVYWDALTPCGRILGSLYDPAIVTQSGASTVVEQQDAWLIRLADSPVVGDAQFAGFDATGGAVLGGYTIHHAVGYARQYTAWYGQAYRYAQSAVLGTTYVSDFLRTVNQLGVTGPGASGSALFDQNNRVVGSLSLGRKTTDPAGYGACPANPLSPPGAGNGVNDFTALAAVWNSTGDTTSSTGTTTLRSVLDPANTGLTVASSMPAALVSFSAATYSTEVSALVQLSWHVPGAVACSATGGATGDGWTGSLQLESSQPVTESVASRVTYGISCQLSGGRTVSAHLAITWGNPTPYVSLTTSWISWIAQPATLTWVSNYSPCSISGGGLSLANLPSSGSTTTTQATPGDVSYNIQCGTTGNMAVGGGSIQFVTPSMTFQANSTDRLAGEPLILRLQSFAQSCTPSGGAPNDGWDSTSFAAPAMTPEFRPQVTTPGTYVYTLSCTSGTATLQKDLTVTIENNPPYVTATASQTTIPFTDTLADQITVNWTSNLSYCLPNSVPWASVITSDFWPQSYMIWRGNPGTYELSVTCTAAVNVLPAITSAPITVTVLPPPAPTAQVSFTPAVVGAGQSFVMNWVSANTMNCSASGTPPPGMVWPVYMTSGSFGDTTSATGTYTVSISCASIDPGQAPATAQATLTVVDAPTATLSASATSLQAGQSLKLTWTSTAATSCTASGGGADGSSWNGTLAASGSATQTATTAGSFTYTLACTGAQSVQSAPVSVTVIISAAPAGGAGGGSGSGGGGGALGAYALLLLAGAAGIRRCRVARP